MHAIDRWCAHGGTHCKGCWEGQVPMFKNCRARTLIDLLECMRSKVPTVSTGPCAQSAAADATSGPRLARVRTAAYSQHAWGTPSMPAAAVGAARSASGLPPEHRTARLREQTALVRF
jgi:hypothetical protein